MFRKRDIAWRALVWVMIPFTLAASLPRMHCRCAAAQGLLFCDCCFQSRVADPGHSSKPKRNCCHAKESHAKRVVTPTVASSQPDCPTCVHMPARKTGSCCSWTAAVLTAPGEGVTPAVPTDTVAWDMIQCDEMPSVLACFTPHSAASALLPQIDRITVFQHLVI